MQRRGSPYPSAGAGCRSTAKDRFRAFALRNNEDRTCGLNPIEQVFAKLKHLMRKAQSRDVELTWRKAGQLLDLFAPNECANYLRNSGYGSV